MKRLLAFSFLALVCVALTVTAVIAGHPTRAQRCSLINLLATPERYDDKLVRVGGCARLEIGLMALFPSRELAGNPWLYNSVWLEVDDPESWLELDSEYIIVEGVFDADMKGHLGGYPSSIHSIKRERIIVYTEPTAKSEPDG